jgi:hypothetical protein
LGRRRNRPHEKTNRQNAANWKKVWRMNDLPPLWEIILPMRRSSMESKLKMSVVSLVIKRLGEGWKFQGRKEGDPPDGIIFHDP